MNERLNSPAGGGATPIDAAPERFARQVVAQSPVMTAVARRTDSTNRTIRHVVDALDREQSVVGAFALIAWEQQAGRGRLGRQWESRAGLGLYLSLFWPLSEGALAEMLPLRVGVAVHRALGRLAPELGVGIKWPNDLLVDGRKLGGILIERLRLTESGDAAVIGIGINHGHDESSIYEGGTSLHLEDAISQEDREGSLADLALAVLSSVVGELEQERLPADIVSDCARRLVHAVGDEVAWQSPQGSRRGLFRGLAEDGSLLLETDDGVTPVHAGEILIDPDAAAS